MVEIAIWNVEEPQGAYEYFQMVQIAVWINRVLGEASEQQQMIWRNQ